MLNSSKHLYLGLFSSLILTTNCGVDNRDVVADQDTATIESQNDERELIDIDVQVDEKEQGFNLTASATAYSLTIDSCASGYTTTVDENSPTVKAYKFDRDCLAKLTTFTINGITYNPDSADLFTTWQAGDTATFEDALDNTNKIAVSVVSTLDNPISGTEAISYAFEDIKKGSDENIAENVVSDTHAISVTGEVAPNFTIAAVSYVGMTAAGAGQFTVKFNCDSNITGSGATTACEGQLMTDLKYKLVEDTYGGTLTQAQAAALFPTGESSIDTGSELLAIGDADAANGGFVSKTLDGPNQMHNKPNMIIIIEAADTSYRYWNMDVTTL